MKALLLKSKNKLAIEDFSMDEPLTPDDVRIQIKDVGICGSDVHYYLHGRIGDFVVREPMVLGHEASGVITEIGSEVTRLKPGDRVCMEPGIPDFMSNETLSGMYNLDPEVRFWATPPVHGCLRESVVHPANLTFKLPDNVSLEEGALVEPVAVGVYSARVARIEPADIALVFGAGTIGIVTALAALASGCSKVILADVKDGKLKTVREHFSRNIVCVNSLKEPLVDAISGPAPEGVDIVFEASGSNEVLSSFTKYLRPGGRAVLIGMPAEPAAIDIVGAQVKEITMSTIFRYRNIYPRALRLISAGVLDVKPLITHRYGFADAVKAFDFAANAPEDAIKIMISL
ncbi:MAG: NAD(P)-dependent alcohol dehydrogenase [Spirochaetia bacterium]|jgi:D-xylulose reductase